MKRITVLATSLLLAGSILLPTAASADPNMGYVASGSPLIDNGNSHFGQVVDIVIEGCTAPGGGPAYAGQFVTLTSLEGSPVMHAEALTDEAGNFTIQTVIDITGEPLTLTVLWYCSPVPITTIADSNIIWMSPPFHYTLSAALAGKSAPSTWTMSTSTDRSKAPTVPPSTASATGPELISKVDPNALPLVDRMNVVGPKATALKTRVDQRVQVNASLSQLIAWLSGRKPTAPTSTDYVAASYQVVTGRIPSAKVMAPFVRRLDSGALRVQVIEDIALTQHDAAWWNTH